MNGAVSTNKVLYADPEHGGIRIAVLFAIALSYLAGFFLIRFLLSRLAAGSPLADFVTVISCIAAIPLALTVSYLVERALKRRWTSGLEFRLEDGALLFEGGERLDGTSEGLSIYWDKRVNLTRWYFHLANYPKAGRERLVPDKWLCLACQMQQDDTRLIAYAYLPPDRAQAWIARQDLSEPFHAISLAVLYRDAGRRLFGAAARPQVPAEMLAGPDGRYWIAERRRWVEGQELSADDFEALMTYIEAKMKAAR